MDFIIGVAVFSALLIVAVASSKISSKFNMPCLLVFLGVGLLAGQEGIGGIPFNDAQAANYLGTIAMAYILFAGGFDTTWRDIRKVFTCGGILSSLGVLLTALAVGIFTYYFLDWILPEKHISFAWCLLLGSIISSTDAPAVFAILRSKSVSLKGKLRPLLEFESGSNDPMATFLTLFMLGAVVTESQTGNITPVMEYLWIPPMFLMKMGIGIVVGIALGYIGSICFNRIDLEFDGLYHVLALGLTAATYSIAEVAQGNGFMAVYVAGAMLGNQKFIYHNSVGRFYDGIAWLMQVILFVMLGLLATPSILVETSILGLIIALFLMVVARPISVYLCMLGSKFTWKERSFVSWVGLRGSVPIMLATFPLMSGIDNATYMFHIVFFIVLSSVVVQGFTLMPVARFLHLDSPLNSRPRVPLLFEHTDTLDGTTNEYDIVKDSPLIQRPLCKLGLPKGALVLLIRRGNHYLVPEASTVIEENDSLMILGNPQVLNETNVFFGVSDDEDED